MAPETNEVCNNAGDTHKNGDVGGQQPPSPSPVPPAAATTEGADDKNKSPRHPRWTRQETLTLIEGKKVAENRGRRGRRSSSVFGSDQLEPKWDSVASYCKQHGVNRGPVQCRKRWSNMVGEFKKIKAWESQMKTDTESYWLMRNDLRKENKLPGFFDREVFDVLDGKAFTKAAYQLALVTVSADAKDENGVETVVGEEEDEDEERNQEGDAEVVFDSGRRAMPDDGLFQDSDKMELEENGKTIEKEKAGVNSHDGANKTIPDPVPISEKRYPPFHQACSQGTPRDQHTNTTSWNGCMSQDGCKRKRVTTDECGDTNLEARLIKVLEKNAKMWNAQLESQNTNCQLDRDQRKDYNDSLVSALNRITDALTKIAEKL